MKPSNDIISFIAEVEGYRDTAYKPLPHDKWTIGYGSTLIHGIPVKEGDTISEEDAFDQLERDVELFAKKLNILGNIPSSVTQEQFDAVVSLCYNIGLGAFTRSETGKMFYDGKDISHKFPLWNKSGGMVVKGLTKRRLAEQKIYDKGEYK